jgi:monothiol glutaredoxin
MESAVRERIEALVQGSRVVLFMKGSKLFPQCGFSAKVVDLLKRSGTEFRDVNVLADPSIRDGVKQFSNWPTIPQLYVDGKFVGGCDIVIELYESGALADMLGSAQA